MLVRVGNLSDISEPQISHFEHIGSYS